MLPWTAGGDMVDMFEDYSRSMEFGVPSAYCSLCDDYVGPAEDTITHSRGCIAVWHQSCWDQHCRQRLQDESYSEGESSWKIQCPVCRGESRLSFEGRLFQAISPRLESDVTDISLICAQGEDNVVASLTYALTYCKLDLGPAFTPAAAADDGINFIQTTRPFMNGRVADVITELIYANAFVTINFLERGRLGSRNFDDALEVLESEVTRFSEDLSKKVEDAIRVANDTHCIPAALRALNGLFQDLGSGTKILDIAANFAARHKFAAEDTVLEVERLLTQEAAPLGYTLVEHDLYAQWIRGWAGMLTDSVFNQTDDDVSF